MALPGAPESGVEPITVMLFTMMLENGQGDGNTSDDWQITGDHTVSVRAERSGMGRGRTYYIKIKATDTFGNESAIRTVTVQVPKSRGN